MYNVSWQQQRHNFSTELLIEILRDNFGVVCHEDLLVFKPNHFLQKPNSIFFIGHNPISSNTLYFNSISFIVSIIILRIHLAHKNLLYPAVKIITSYLAGVLFVHVFLSEFFQVIFVIYVTGTTWLNTDNFNVISTLKLHRLLINHLNRLKWIILQIVLKHLIVYQFFEKVLYDKINRIFNFTHVKEQKIYHTSIFGFDCKVQRCFEFAHRVLEIVILELVIGKSRCLIMQSFDEVDVDQQVMLENELQLIKLGDDEVT